MVSDTPRATGLSSSKEISTGNQYYRIPPWSHSGWSFSAAPWRTYDCPGRARSIPKKP